MNFAAFITKLKSDLTRFYSKESVLNNELRRTPLWRSSQNPFKANFGESPESEIRLLNFC
jgi:hypothetical protein